MPISVSRSYVFLTQLPPGERLTPQRRKAFLLRVLELLTHRHQRSFHLHDTGARPQLGAGEGQLSLSHTRNWIGLAYHPEGPVGFDLEERSRQLVNADAIARRFFSAEEAAALGPSPASEALLRVWTHKEALLKIEGRGLHEEIGDSGNLSLRHLAAKWHVHDLTQCGEFPEALLGAVAVARPGGEPEIIRVPLPAF